MREIKFRAWDKRNKIMCIVHRIDLNDFKTGIGKFDAILRPLGNLSEEIITDEIHCELMQYTGLKDKNGKEIYEGDIVKIKYKGNLKHDAGQAIAIIGFKDGAFYFNVKKQSECLKQSMGIGIPLWHEEDAEERTIIGNIYENPELIK